MGAPAVGTVIDGYRFNGGDPNNQASWVKVAAPPKLTTQDAEALASARRDAEAGDLRVRQAERFLGYNQETGTGGLRNTKIKLPVIGTVVDVPAIMSMTNPNWGAMESITASTAPKDRVEGSGPTSDFDARMNIIGFPNVTQLGPTNTQTTARIRAEAARARARAAFLDRWAKDRGTLLGADTAFVQWWERYSKEKGIGGDIRPAPSGGRQTPPRKPVQAAPAAGTPRVGEVRRGWRFKGGDPANRNNWVKVQ